MKVLPDFTHKLGIDLNDSFTQICPFDLPNYKLKYKKSTNEKMMHNE